AAGLASATFEQRRQLAELLIDRVIVTGDEVEIRYAIPTDERGEHIRFCQLRLDYFRDPDLVRSYDVQGFDQIGIARESVVTVRGPLAADGSGALDAQFRHQPPHVLAVDRAALAAEQGRQTAVAVRRPLPSQALHGRSQVGLLGRRRCGRAIQPTARVIEEPADEAGRVLVGQGHDDLPFLSAVPGSSLEAFFKISNSKAWRPASCS